MAIPIFDKFKSVTEEGVLLDYDEIADIPIERRDLATNPPTEDGYYQQTVSSGNFDKGVIYRRYSNDYIIPIDPLSYVDLQNLEDGRYDLSAYGFVDDKALENYVPKTSTGDIYITSNADLRLDASGGNGTTCINMDGVDSWMDISAEDIYLNGNVHTNTISSSENININAATDMYLSASTGNEEIYINLQKSNKDIAIAGDTIHLSGEVYENNEKLSEKYASKLTVSGMATDVQNHEQELQTHQDNFRALDDGLYDLSAYQFASQQDIDNLYLGTFDLSRYNFISSDKLKGLDTYSEDTFGIDIQPNGITWENTVAYLDKDNDIITQGTYYGLAPIVAGDNVTFTVDEENQVVKINATGGGTVDLSGYVPTNSNADVSITTSSDMDLDASSMSLSANGEIQIDAGGTATITMSGHDNSVVLQGGDQLDIALADRSINISGDSVYLNGQVYENNTKLSDKYLGKTAVSVTQKLTSGTEIGSVTVGSTTTKLYAPTATTTPIGSILDVGSIRIDGENYSLENIDNPNNNIYLGDDTIEINGMGIGLNGDTTIVGQGAVNLAVGENDEAYISLNTDGIGSGVVDISANEISLNGNVTVNGEPIGSGGGKRKVTLAELKEFLQSAEVGQQVQIVPNVGEDVFVSLGACVALTSEGYLESKNQRIGLNESADGHIFVATDNYIFINIWSEDAYVGRDLYTVNLSDQNVEHRSEDFRADLTDENCNFYILSGCSLTEAEKSSIVNDVIAQLPVYDGEVL